MHTESAPAQSMRPAKLSELRVAVIGAGLMGHSIAAVLASGGATVTLFDSQPDVLLAAPARMRELLLRLERDPSTADQIGLADGLDAAVDGVHLVMEAAPEQLELKQQLFSQIAKAAPEAVLATNTSVFRIGDVFADVTNPERSIGTHWWNPPHLIPVVEVVQSNRTSPDIALWMIDLLRQAGKVPIHVRKDVPGFIGNRLQHALWREAISLIEAGVCDAETLDLLVRNSFGLRLAAMGPIENADYVGLDLILSVHDYLFPSLNRDKQAAQTLRDLVAAGHLGAKTGAGFLQWEPGSREIAAQRLEQHLISQVASTTSPTP